MRGWGVTPSRSRRALLVALLMTLGVSLPTAALAADEVPPGWFVWPSVQPVPGSALDTSVLNDKPAGAHGRIAVRDGVFVTSDDGARIRFWGCNLSSGEAFPADAATAERVARRCLDGYDCIR